MNRVGYITNFGFVFFVCNDRFIVIDVVSILFEDQFVSWSKKRRTFKIIQMIDRYVNAVIFHILKPHCFDLMIGNELYKKDATKRVR